LAEPAETGAITFHPAELPCARTRVAANLTDDTSIGTLKLTRTDDAARTTLAWAMLRPTTRGDDWPAAAVEAG
jgi:hypothetical protein